MGKKTKFGKSRLDKFYHLAKDQGYRSRASFKLIQLNRKFDFLSNAKACLDLCAAPGGWLQVAAKYMPLSSIIVGVDLFAIRPIKNVITLKQDITTIQCRQAIKRELKTYKVDVVLHDGAPNVGSSWAKDAYGQAELTLHSLKLGVEFMNKGAWFVTKVFRSKDYNALIWVFTQLFEKVEATKPAASRNTSAEIFVVCRGFLAPKKLDPRLLDPKTVFSDDIPVHEAMSNKRHGRKERPNQLGYADDAGVLLSTQGTVSALLDASKPDEYLSSVQNISFDEGAKDLELHPLTTPELLTCFKDTQVLGKGDFKTIIKWVKKVKRSFKKLQDEKHGVPEGEEKADDESGDEEVEDGDEDEEKSAAPHKEEKSLKGELDDLLTTRAAEAKKKRRRMREKLAQQQRRIDMKLDNPGDEIVTADDEMLFSARLLKSKSDIEKVLSEDAMAHVEFDEDKEPLMPQREFVDDVYMSDDEIERERQGDLEDEIDAAYTEYKNRTMGRLERQKAERENKKIKPKDELKSMNEVFEEEIDKIEQKAPAPLVEELEHLEPQVSDDHRVSMFFSREGFDDLIEDEDQALIDGENDQEKKKPHLKRPAAAEASDEDDDSESDSDDDNSESESDGEYNYVNEEDQSGDFEVVPEEAYDDERRDNIDPRQLSQTLQLGVQINKSKSERRKLVDDSFHRYSFSDVNGPDWLLDDEKRFNKLQVPVTRDVIAQVKAKFQDVNARPIKKIAEAKLRKRQKAAKKNDKLKREAENIAANEDMDVKSKNRQLEQLRRKSVKSMSGRQKKEVVVAKKFQGKSSAGKGKKLVDKRMKKDLRAQKRIEKRDKGKKKPSSRKKRKVDF